MSLAGLACGLRVSARELLRRERSLPIDGDVLVATGDRVEPETVLARAMLPGRLSVIDAAARLGVGARELPALLADVIDREVAAGEVIARSSSLFGLLRSELRSPVSGWLISVSAASGQIMIEGEPAPLSLNAFLAGEVTALIPGRGAVVEGEGALVQGICGFGAEATGLLAPAAAGPDRPLDPGSVPLIEGSVLFAGAGTRAGDLEAVAAAGAAAVALGGIDAGELDAFMAATTASRRPVLLLTEGYGALSMSAAAWDLLCGLAGRTACVSGLTQIRAGVVRPELIVPDAGGAGDSGAKPDAAGADSSGLVPGLKVRLVRDPGFGTTGVVVALPAEPAALPSGVVTRVALVRCDDGVEMSVALRNLEPIGTGAD